MSSELIERNQKTVLKVPADIPSKKDLTRLRGEAMKWHRKALHNTGMALANTIACGFLLLQIKQMMKHGEFTAWVEKTAQTEIGFGMRTVQRYKRLAEDFIKLAMSRGHSCETEQDLQQHLNSDIVADFDATQQQKRAERRIAQIDPNDWHSPQPVLAAVKSVLGEIECDPCALSDEWATNLAEINITAAMDGLAEAIAWGRTSWVCPGHEVDPEPWFAKAQTELAAGNLEQAVLCVPESALTLPVDLLRYPIAVTSSPLTVTLRRSGRTLERQLPTRSLFVYMTAAEADLELFARAFCDIAVVFAPIALDL